MNEYTRWTPHSYPMYSPHTEDPPRSPSVNGIPQPPKEESLPRLPKVIRAVKDANTYKYKGRTLVVCLDGTGDKFDNDNSNVVHLVSCLKKDDPSQVTYYQSGIGTYDGKGMRSGISAAADMAVGSGLGVHVQDAYKFLMQTYREGDKICLFGFSRGAYTARCVAGMLHKVGLLPAHNVAQVPFAYQFYKDDSKQGWKMSDEFKKTFCINASVYFVGVWDCVASVGFIPRKLPFSSTPTSRTGHFRHAMALDEHRAKFKCLPWQKRGTKGQIESERVARELAELRAAQNPRPSEHVLRTASTRLSAKKLGLSRSTTDGSTSSQHAPNEVNGKVNGKVNGNVNGKVNGKPKTKEPDMEKKMRTEKPEIQSDVLEVWFTGCHADVGGGAVANDKRHKLSQIPLRWMIRQCFECNTGILFDTAMLADNGLDVHTLHPVYQQLTKPVVGPSPKMMEKYEAGDLVSLQRRSSHIRTFSDEKELNAKREQEKSGIKFSDRGEKEEFMRPEGDWIPEQVEDYFDAMAPMNDQLVDAKGWWILEFWPIKIKIQRKGEDEWEKKISVNRGRYRPVQDLDPNVHWTVRQRMRDKGYKMKTRNDRNSVWTTVV